MGAEGKKAGGRMKGQGSRIKRAAERRTRPAAGAGAVGQFGGKPAFVASGGATWTKKMKRWRS